jgi:hypothetical protein
MYQSFSTPPPRPRRRAQPLSPRTYRRRRFVFLGVVAAVIALVVTGSATLLKNDQRGGSDATLGHRSAVLDRKIAALQQQLHRERANAISAQQAPPAAAAAGAPSANSDSFAKLESTLPGEAGLAYTAPGVHSAPADSGSVSSGSAWSTIKLALALRTTLDAGGPPGLTSSQRSLISRALTESDNAAAMGLWDGLISHYGSSGGAASATARGMRRAGDSETQVSTVGRDGFSPYGQTEWSLPHQAQFMGALAGGCLADRATTDYLLDEMGQVVSSQSWGLGSAGVPAKFKGGWGPGTSGGYLVRQTGVLQTRGGPLVLAIAALPSDGSLETGTQMLTTIARWAATHVRPSAAGGC